MKRLRKDLYRSRWILLTTCALLLLIQIWQARHRPERLITLPYGLPRLIHDGQIFWTTEETREPNKRTLVLYARPVTGGRAHEVGHDTFDHETQGYPTLTEEGLFYTVSQLPNLSGNAMIVARAVMRRIPLTGGPAQTLPISVQSLWMGQGEVRTSYAIVGSTLYYLSGPLDGLRTFHDKAHAYRRRVARRDANGKQIPTWVTFYRSEPILRSELKAVPLAGGTPQTLATGLSRSEYLVKGEKGVFWHGAPPADGSSSLCYARAGEAQIFRRSDFPSASFPLEFQDHFYWAETTYDTSRLPDRHIQRCDLRVMSRDDPRPRRLARVVSDAQRERELSGLTTYRRRLYALLKEGHLSSDKTHSVRVTLCRIAPERADPLVRLLVFPLNAENLYSSPFGHFDGDFLYFTVNEEKENWFDWSSNGLPPQISSVLYRYRLPD